MAFNLTATLRLRDDFTNKMRRATSGATAFKRATGSASSSAGNLEKSLGLVSRRAGDAVTSLGRTAAAFTAVGAASVAAGAAYGITKLSKQAMQLSSESEQANIAFKTMLGSQEKADQFLAKITEFAAATPFDLPQLRDASKKMLAFGFSAEQVIPYLTGIGNAAAGLGLGKEGVDRLTLALGQMRAKGKVQGDEMLQLVEAGIPAWEILAKKMHVTTAEVQKMSEKGIIPADKAIKALVDGMNSRFPNMMDEMSHSTQGLFDKMKDTFSNKLLVRFGDGIGKALKPRFERLSAWIDANGDTIKRWGDNLERIASKATNALATNVERGFNHVKSILDDPEYKKKLTDSGKFEFVIQSFKDSFDKWYESGGKKQIDDTVKSLVGYVGAAVKAAYGPFKQIGVDIGRPLADGMLDGMRQFAKSSPELAALLAFIGTPGPVPLKIAAALGVGGQGSADKYFGVPTFGKAEDGSTTFGYKGGVKIPGTEQILKVGDAIKDALTTPGDWKSNLKATGDSVIHSHHEGIGSVPYNGYRTTLHKDERVLTKSENADYSSGKSGYAGAPTINITVNGGVRSDKDIDAIAMALARGLEGLQGAKPQ